MLEFNFSFRVEPADLRKQSLSEPVFFNIIVKDLVVLKSSHAQAE